jgi:hypothetical protein
MLVLKTPQHLFVVGIPYVCHEEADHLAEGSKPVFIIFLELVP